MLDMAGDAVTGGNTNIFSKARPKFEPKILPIRDHNVFNCEEKILETADQHEQDVGDLAGKDFEAEQ